MEPGTGKQSARLYRVHGRVQGVGYRWFAKDAAGELRVTGYVKNLHDGSVEVYAVGSDEQLDALRLRLEQGPPGARVTRVDEGPAPLRPCHTFRMEY